MGFGVQGAPGAQPPGGPQGAQNAGAESTLESAIKASQDAALIFDSEAQAVDKKMIGQDKSKADMLSQSQKTEQNQRGAPEVAEAYAASMTDEVEKKKRKKKLSKWEEKMAELENLEGVVKEEDVDNEEEKGVIREFFDNMRKIKKLRRDLKQTEEKRKRYEELLDNHRRQQKSGG